MANRKTVCVRLAILALSCTFLTGVGPCSKGGPDLALLTDFVIDDDALMQAFMDANPNPMLGDDVTVYGPAGGSCRWTIFGSPFTGTEVTYDYQNYNDSGIIMNGVRSGEAGLFLWTLSGTIELSGTANGWIYYQMPMNGLAGPILSLRTWRVCNYDNGCTNEVGDIETEGTSFFRDSDL